MIERIDYTNSSLKVLEVFVEPDAASFNLDRGQSMMIYIENTRPKYKDEFALDYDGDILTIHQPRQSDLRILINNQMVFYSAPDRPMGRY